MEQGQLEMAQKDILEALGIYESSNMEKELAEAATNLAVLLLREGLYSDAQEQLSRARKIFEELGDERSLATVMTNMADLARLQGDYSAALILLEKALAIKEKTNDIMGQAAALQAKAEILWEQEEQEQAQEHLQQSLFLRTTIKDSLGEGNCQLRLSQWLLQTGGGANLDEAETRLARARESFARAGYRHPLQQVLYWEGRVAEAKGKEDTAEKKYQDSIDLLESTSYHLPDSLKTSDKDRERRSECYAAQAGLLLRQERFSEALALVERSRDRDLAETFIGDTSQESSYQAKLSAFQERIEQALQDRNEKLAAFLRQAAENTEEDYAQYVENLFRENPHLHALTNVEPEALKRVRKHLDDKSLMIQYLFFENTLFMFAVSSDKLGYKTVEIDRKNLEDRIMYLRELLGSSYLNYAATSQDEEKQAQFEKFFFKPMKQVGQRLYNEILGPLEEMFEGKSRLIIVPHQCLHYLPFATLVVSVDDEGQPRFLVEDFEILKQGSLTLFDFARAGEKEGAPEDLEILAFGNADGTLPSAQYEAECLRNVFPSAEILLRDEAKESIVKDRFKEGSPSDIEILHLATHAALSPKKSYIRLAPDWEKGEDGMLTRQEILGLDMAHVRLVTLSACETAIGEHSVQGDEIYGLEQSFVKATAETVISTLWPVEDTATGEFMQTFYERLSQNARDPKTKGKLKKLESLRAAQLSLLKNPRYSHPYFWAPFVMTGEAE